MNLFKHSKIFEENFDKIFDVSRAVFNIVDGGVSAKDDVCTNPTNSPLFEECASFK